MTKLIHTSYITIQLKLYNHASIKLFSLTVAFFIALLASSSVNLLGASSEQEIVLLVAGAEYTTLELMLKRATIDQMSFIVQ